MGLSLSARNAPRRVHLQPRFRAPRTVPPPMVSSLSTGAAEPIARSLDDAPTPAAPGGAAAPNARLRALFIALFALIAVASGMRNEQYLLFTPLPIPLLFLSPRGASRVLVFFALVLVVIGGAVTTYREGMAVPDWPATFQENMWTYSLREMLEQGKGVTLEHVHRLWASALGLVAFTVMLTTYVHRSRRALKAMAWATGGAIAVQAVIGGTRVLEVSQNLAFLHGVIAQAVFATIAVLAVMSSRTWQRMDRTGSAHARGAHGLGPWVVGLLYVQIALGAWLRHHGQTAALLVHGTLALAVVVLVLVFARQLGIAASEGRERGIDRAPLRRLERLILGAVSAQFLLGILATYGIYGISGGMQNEVSVGEAIFATSHVLVGAVLFCATVVGAVYARRTLAPGEVSA